MLTARRHPPLTDEQLDALARYGERYSPGDELATRILQAVGEIREQRRAQAQQEGIHPISRIFADVLRRAHDDDNRKRVRWIQAIVSDEYGVATDWMLTSRTAQAKRIRWIAMALCREMTTAASTQVAHLFGVHHTTVLYACRRRDAAHLAELERVRVIVEQEIAHRAEQSWRRLQAAERGKR